MLINSTLLKKCLFVDMETVSEKPCFSDLSETKQKLWVLKAAQIRKYLKPDEENKTAEELYTEKAGIFAEFARVVCISCGYLVYDGEMPYKVKIKSIAGEDEKKILQDFSDLLTHHYGNIDTSKICGHNIKEFDIPFICRRWVIHQIPLAPILDISGKKPWQTQHLLDTMDMWRFGDYKNYTSLSLLAGTLDIPTPKDDIDGSQVGHVYWKENNLDRIVTYCQKDVLTVAQIMMRFASLPLLSEEQVEILPWK